MTNAEPISADRLHEALARGGLVVTDAPGGTETPPAPLPRYNALRDPGGGEALGRSLAQTLAGDVVGTVMIWEDAADVALGFVVARERSVPAVRCVDNEGLVAYEGSFGDAEGIAIVADTLRDAEPVRAMLALAEQQHKSVLVAALLVETSSPGVEELRARGITVRSLVAARNPT